MNYLLLILEGVLGRIMPSPGGGVPLDMTKNKANTCCSNG
jgi:hypothetical protein